MQDWTGKVAYGVGGAAVLAVLAYVIFSVAGSVVVFDKSGQVSSALVTNNDKLTQRLMRLPGGVFYAIPQVEGAVEIHCRSGERVQRGYVTGHMHTWLTVEPDNSCGTITYVR
jgi:predicted deacylase